MQNGSVSDHAPFRTAEAHGALCVCVCVWTAWTAFVPVLAQWVSTTAMFPQLLLLCDESRIHLSCDIRQELVALFSASVNAAVAQLNLKPAASKLTLSRLSFVEPY